MTDCDEAGYYVVPNVLSPRDLVSRPVNKDETVPHTCILFCRAMYSTANCGQTVCARSDLGRPAFQSGCFLTHAFCTAVLILDFDSIQRFCIVASFLCLKQILDSVHIGPTVMCYMNILLKSIVSRKSKRTGYQICFILLYSCIFICI